MTSMEEDDVAVDEVDEPVEDKKKGPLREFLNNEEEGGEVGPDVFSTPVARVRSLKDNRNAIFVATVTRGSDEDWDTLFEKERQREQQLREEFAKQRLQEEEEEKKLKVEAEKKQLPMLDGSKVAQGNMNETVRQIGVLVSQGEKLTDAVADAYQANNNESYAAAASEIVKRSAPLHLTALIAAAAEAEKFGRSLIQSKSQDPAVLESRVDHIIQIANQFDRLQTFLNKHQKVTSGSTPTSSTRTTTSPLTTHSS